MAKEKAIQIWKFTKTQSLLITEQAVAHVKELEPFRLYQQRAQNDLLVQFKEEHGIHKDTPLTVDLDNLQFILRDEIPAPTEPVLVEDPAPNDEPAAE